MHDRLAAWNIPTDSWNEPTKQYGASLLNNTLAGIRYSNFLDQSEVSKVLSRIDEVGIEYYDGDDKSGTVSRKGKIGPNFFRFKDNPDEYFQRAKRDIVLFESLILKDVDVLTRLLSLAESVFDRQAKFAYHNDQQMMPCTIRDLPSAPPHRDWMPGENTLLSFAENVTDQLAWNVYLKLGEEGGETIIYNESNVEAISTTTQSTRNTPQRGDLLLFRSTNVHEVLPTRGNRLTLSGFFGPSGSKELRFWV